MAYKSFTHGKKRLSFTSQLLPSVHFLFSYVSLTEKECNSIFYTILLTIRRLHKVSSTFSSLVNLPECFGRFLIPPLYLLRISRRLNFLIASIQNNCHLGKTLRILIETQQLESGISASNLRII